MLREVTVTATEGKGVTSTSVIGRSAMRHLQPTSFTDILSLLPGGMTRTPDMSSVNSIALRETGNLGALGTSVRNPDYYVSSLGTLFVVDGAPVSTDADLQAVGAGDNSASSAVNRGVDMRAISTDNIESVEVVRGIASAEYGNLTSGMVKIKRIRRAMPLTARFKADQYSKLAYIGKGIAAGGNTLNADIGWLDSKSDPRDPYSCYTRVSVSARATAGFGGGATVSSLSLSADYTGTIDRDKADPDLALHRIDEFRSSRHSAGLTASYSFTLPFFRTLENVDAIFSANYQTDRLTRRCEVAPGRAAVAPTSMEEGVHDGRYILGSYVADYLCDGRPLSLFFKLKAAGHAERGIISHRYCSGAEWTMSKNYGRGQVYDLEYPLSASWTSRPRDFRTIPAGHTLSFFAEDDMTLSAGRAGRFRLAAGVRAIMLPHLDSSYYLSGRPYLDPRINLNWHLPSLSALRVVLAAGWGISTRMPTFDYLYPQPVYNDFIQLNYYDTRNPLQNSRVNLRTYIDDATNRNLRAARNVKHELRLDASIGGNRLSVTYFSERLRSGFRYSTVYRPYSYRRYDPAAIDAGTLNGPPSLDGLPYTEVEALGGTSMVTNGSRIDKQGVEFTLTTARWKSAATALTVTGAWFRSVYSNSQRVQRSVGDVAGGVAVGQYYAGVYNTLEGRVNTRFNTNFMFDTQVARLGLIFSTTVECMWLTSTTELPENGTPEAYIDVADGSEHPYTAEAVAANPLLAYLSKSSASVPQTLSVPPAVYVNLKATKEIGKLMRVAVFVNRIIDRLPDYKSNGITVRRGTDAYFGMEINITI